MLRYRHGDLLPYMSSSPRYIFQDNEKTLAREYEPIYHSGDRIIPSRASTPIAKTVNHHNTRSAIVGITLVDKPVSTSSSGSSKKETNKISLWISKFKKFLKVGKK